MITIAVDAMGGDHAPRPEVEGSVLAAREFGVRILLVGQQNVVRAEVTSASPLPPAKTQAIEKRLAAITGKSVSMVATVDPAIVGGVIARVGSTVYDASLATQLKKIRERLTT